MPRPLSLMSGNFDDPPASESDRETAQRIVRAILDGTQLPDDISPSGELYRVIGRFHRARGTANPLGAASIPPLETMSNEADRGQRDEQDTSPLFVPPQPGSGEYSRLRRVLPPGSFARRSGGPPGSSRTTPGGGPPVGSRSGTVRARYLERNRPTSMENSGAGNGLADLQHAGRQLEQASSNLRALLDDPVPELSSPPLEPRDYSPDNDRRAKRRKLETDSLDNGFKGFSYGRYGQVEPGKLKMEIVSCDGGIFDNHSGNYAAENVLRNDGTVYCTKSNRCNLVLRHQGATVFCLKELVIKAPHSGYTAPVQEGMVFISMTSDDLLTRTAQYQIQYSPARSRRSESRSNDLPRIMSIRHHDDGSMTTAQIRARRLYDIGVQDEECDYRTAQIPSDFTENTNQFQVTTECSDSEGDEAPSSRSARHRLHRVMGLRFEDSESSEEEDAERPNQSGWHEDYLLGVGRRPRRRDTASNITLSEAAEASQIATQEAVRAVGGELMAPHARFFIERDKSKCTVRFDPPVSGRFILLKMWSPHHSPSGNIDIQSVVAKGFAGPRFFPAVNLR